jgi:hypothetical protein
MQFQMEACSRSEGPAVSSPVRKGGVDSTVSCLSAEGAPRFVPALRASGYQEAVIPALTDGATNCRSFGPKKFKLHQYLSSV